MTSRGAFDVLVVGGGLTGLATLYHLTRRGVRAGLVERARLGHDGGSSHGASRITRSTYEDAAWVRLVRAAHREEWPRLERHAGKRLVHPAPGCFFGPAGPALDAYTAAVAAAGDDVEVLSPAAARRQFAAFRFPDAAAVLHDRSAGIVAAADTLDALARLCRAAGAELLEGTPIDRIDLDGELVRLAGPGGTLAAERVVVAAGPWTSRLVPALQSRLTVARQSVAYFRLGAPAAAQRAPAFPVWAYLGPEHLLFYGLPEFGGPGVKVARHTVSGRDDDPDRRPAAVDDAAVDELRAFLDEQLAVPVERLERAEHCLYTNTATEDFVLDALPDDPRVVVGAGFSGHGFKFGPLTGRILAELSLDGTTSVPEFETERARFAFC